MACQQHLSHCIYDIYVRECAIATTWDAIGENVFYNEPAAHTTRVHSRPYPGTRGPDRNASTMPRDNENGCIATNVWSPIMIACCE